VTTTLTAHYSAHHCTALSSTQHTNTAQHFLLRPGSVLVRFAILAFHGCDFATQSRQKLITNLQYVTVSQIYEYWPFWTKVNPPRICIYASFVCDWRHFRCLLYPMEMLWGYLSLKSDVEEYRGLKFKLRIYGSWLTTPAVSWTILEAKKYRTSTRAESSRRNLPGLFACVLVTLITYIISIHFIWLLACCEWLQSLWHLLYKYRTKPHRRRDRNCGLEGLRVLQFNSSQSQHYYFNHPSLKFLIMSSPVRGIEKGRSTFFNPVDLPSISRDEILLTGFLVKEGGSWKSWKRRFFVLSRGGTLNYY
jgi:hypothetical protein